jgi:hypothetical protein
MGRSRRRPGECVTLQSAGPYPLLDLARPQGMLASTRELTGSCLKSLELSLSAAQAEACGGLGAARWVATNEEVACPC